MDINGYLMDMNGYEWMVFHPNHGSFTMVLTVLTPIPMFFLMFLQTSTKMGMQHFCEDGELLQKFWIYSHLPKANWENDS